LTQLFNVANARVVRKAFAVDCALENRVIVGDAVCKVEFILREVINAVYIFFLNNMIILFKYSGRISVRLILGDCQGSLHFAHGSSLFKDRKR
jgi:hypothetical protein